MKIITGQVARKENFWNRKNQIEDIWYKLENSENILLVAPRRVGKTSVMYNILDKPKDNFIILYINTESVDSESEFWKKLFYKLKEEEFISNFKKISRAFIEKLKNLNISEISTKGIKFGENYETDYIKAFKTILKELNIEKKLIIMIDEFAQTIENIIKYEDEKGAKRFLHSHRELRQDDTLSQKVNFIYAGSIGLESIASKIDSISSINDLSIVKIPPLEKEEAHDFIKTLCKDNKVLIEDEEIKYLLEKIKWLIPFYIQLLVDYLKKEKTKITKENIDKAFDFALENRNHFEHWHTRLKSFKDDEYRFLKEILNIISENEIIKSNEILNIAQKYSLSEDLAKDLVHSIVYDGYVNNNENIKIYRFNSPILSKWWYKNIAN